MGSSLPVSVFTPKATQCNCLTSIWEVLKAEGEVKISGLLIRRLDLPFWDCSGNRASSPGPERCRMVSKP